MTSEHETSGRVGCEISDAMAVEKEPSSRAALPLVQQVLAYGLVAEGNRNDTDCFRSTDRL
jgi:hypothetical protein